MHVPIPAPGDLGIRVSCGFRVNSERIPFDADELIRTRLSNRRWQLYRVPADQIEPIKSDWKQILSAPGIHVAGQSYGTYRVAIDDSYIPWLENSKFKFQPDINPLKPVDEEVSAHGKWVATRNAVARFHRDALKAIFSRKSPELDSCYRNLPEVPHQVALEWAILKRDMIHDSEVKTRFTQLLLFITLNLVDDYDTPLVLSVLGKDEDELLDGLWNIYSDPSVYLPSKIANFKAEDEILEAQNAAEFHRLSLVRSVLELAGVKMDVRQDMLDLEYTVNYNHNILGSMLGFSGSKPFGTFASQKMLDALSKSLVFPDDTAQLDVMKLSADVMRRVPIGFPDGYLGLPFEVLSKLPYGQVQMIAAEMFNFYYDRRSLETPQNNVLVLLTWNPIRHMTEEVLVEWAASVDGQRLHERIIKDLRGPQSKEQLVLTLAAFLSYQRLFPPTSDTSQPIKGSYQADFDAILNGKRLSNARTVSEYMVLSVLRVFYTVKDNEKMRTFLANVLDMRCWPSLDPFHEFSDQYFICRMRDELGHEDALKIADTKVGPARSSEKMVEMVTLDNGEEVVAMQEHRVLAFPPAVFHLDAYKLIYVCLPKVPPHEKILSTISLPNGLSVVIVLGSYVSALEQDLDTKCWEYNIEPSREDVELLGLVEAQNQKVDALAKMAVDIILRDSTLEKGLWICADLPCVLNLFTTWLREVVSRSKRDSPAFPELTGFENDSESGRVQLDGYNFNSYTLVRVSNLGHYAQTLDKLGNFDEILSIEELQDGWSWELPVHKSYLPKLKDKLREMAPHCIIESNYDPTEPNAKEVKEFGYKKARILRSLTFRDRAERMIHEALPKGGAFYHDLIVGGDREMDVDDYEMDMDIFESCEEEEEEEEEMAGESTDECWVMVNTLRLQSPVA